MLGQCLINHQSCNIPSMNIVLVSQLSDRPTVVGLQNNRVKPTANNQPSAHAFSTCVSLMDARQRALQEFRQHIIGSVKVEFHIFLKWRRYQFGDQIHALAILTPE
jgi:hypothetical protein